MKKLFLLLVTAIATVGCTVTPHDSAIIVTGPPLVSIVDYCDPSDWNYLETEYDCHEAFYTIELCDPYDYHYRPGCWDWWEADQEFYDCYETHYCFMEPN